ncbi:MAG: FKBP-type peptidyl-prolyl cis-trans isomerase 2 [Hyphomicrobiaceae bacterium]|jgi:FKBP-type peptidyl-prolyl cis-trans isomerase 2
MITTGSKVSIEYTLTLDDGRVVDTNVEGEALVYEQGSEQILPALEAELAGLAVDDVKKVSLTAEQGYGPIQPDAFHTVEPDEVPEAARVAGTTLVAQDESGGQRPVRVAEVHEDRIVIDLNHPLAGENLSFDVKILSIE